MEIIIDIDEDKYHTILNHATVSYVEIKGDNNGL